MNVHVHALHYYYNVSSTSCVRKLTRTIQCVVLFEGALLLKFRMDKLNIQLMHTVMLFKVQY